MKSITKIPLLLAISFFSASACAQKGAPRDKFFWLGEMNKATAVINTDEGLLDKTKAPKIAAGIVKVLEDGAKPGAKRPFRVIEFEPLMISAAGQDVTLLHAGRSSQDMFATYRAAIMRDNLLNLADQLNKASESLVKLAEEHAKTIVPNYTHGVAAQPNSLGHMLLGHAAGFERDAQRIRQAYARVDRSPMGTTVLNGSSWPLNRTRMAECLGFAAIVDNAYDASQILAAEYPVEVASIVTSLGLHVGHFVNDITLQYSQTRPWMLLQPRGMNTRSSSAMPQKQNPVLLSETRRDVSSALAMAMGPVMRAHNIPTGMPDAKEESTNSEMVQSAIQFLTQFDRILNSLAIDPERALEELNSDWTASQELADVLMAKYKVPFRVGHHFGAEVVKYGKARNSKPLDFPYVEAKRIFQESIKEYDSTLVLPMNEQEFRSTLNPVAIVQNRRTVGGPQMSEMKRMLALAKQQLADQSQWINSRRAAIENARTKLDKDFSKLLTP